MKCKACNNSFPAKALEEVFCYDCLSAKLQGYQNSPDLQPENIHLLKRVMDYARMHIETTLMPPEHPLSIAVRDYQDYIRRTTP